VERAAQAIEALVEQFGVTPTVCEVLARAARDMSSGHAKSTERRELGERPCAHSVEL